PRATDRHRDRDDGRDRRRRRDAADVGGAESCSRRARFSASRRIQACCSCSFAPAPRLPSQRRPPGEKDAKSTIEIGSVAIPTAMKMPPALKWKACRRSQKIPEAINIERNAIEVDA